MIDTKNQTEQVAEHVARLSYSSLPEAVIDKARWVVLDSLAGQLACSTLDHGRRAVAFARELRGSEEASVVGADFKTGVEHAALVNGILGHGDEIDEPRHRSSVLLPAVLAAAEKEHASGQELIVALVAGYDVATRLANAGLDLGHLAPRNFHEGSIPGSLAAGAAVAKLLGLDRSGIQTAMGNGAEQACGLQAMRQDPSHMNKSLHMGVGARNGLTAAYLAQAGYGSGVQAILDPPYSIFEAFVPDGWQPEEVTLELGERYDILATGFKKYAAGRPIHSAIASLLELLESNAIDPSEIGQVTVRLPTLEHGLLTKSEMLNINIEYVIAVSALDGQVTWDQFSEERRADPLLNDLWGRIRSRADTDLDQLRQTARGSRPAGVDLILKDGRELSMTMAFPPGHPENPMSGDEMNEKFRVWSTVALGVEQSEALAQTVAGLEHVRDMNELGELVRVG